MGSAFQSSSNTRIFKFFTLLFFFPFVFCLAPEVDAQQPFITDDTDVTAKRQFHFEFSNEFDVLQRSAFPNLKQNTASFELNYGLTEGVELAIEAPLLTLINARSFVPRTTSGVGDTNFAVKYNFLKEQDDSRQPAMSVSVNFEIPTGDASRQLGSGVADFSLNGILQKTLTERTTLRLNGGLIFSGNTVTGALGIRTRGTVLTGGASLVRKFTARLSLGAEVTGAFSGNRDLSRGGQLQTQVGGNYALRENLTLDFGVIAGGYTASPRLGAQIGVSVDF
ncbi:MAG: hypothetical protein WKF30_01235 [Pyrinomonadaceae bacterium]